MRERTAGLFIGILAVVCLGLVLSVFYPFTTAAPHGEDPVGDRFSVPDADAFSASGRITVDGETRLAFEGVVTAEGAWYQRVVDVGVVSAEYYPGNGSVFRRITVEGADPAEQRRAHLAEDGTILHESRDGDCVTFVTESTRVPEEAAVSGTASVFVNNLWVAGYEPAGADSAGVTTYRPQPGWYESGETYRLTDVSGTVRAEAATGAVTSANVSWTLTRAETYAHFVLAGVVSDGSTESRTTVAVDAAPPTLERPAWVSNGDTAASTAC